MVRATFETWWVSEWSVLSGLFFLVRKAFVLGQLRALLIEMRTFIAVDMNLVPTKPEIGIDKVGSGPRAVNGIV